MQKKRALALSKTSTLHYIRLVYRSILFVIAVVTYIINRVKKTGYLFGGLEKSLAFLMLIWTVFLVEMILRFFPTKIESLGCEKQFARNFKLNKNAEIVSFQGVNTKSILVVIAFWAALNTTIGILYLTNIIDKGILLLISLAYAVCDMICILFFCPFQTWIMKNKCCVSCRIYNWDFAMIFTPLIFIKNAFTWSLLALAIILLIKWEIIHKRYPERFIESKNANLSCANCDEKLCQHKKQLQKFLVDQKKLLKKLEKRKENYAYKSHK